MSAAPPLPRGWAALALGAALAVMMSAALAQTPSPPEALRAGPGADGPPPDSAGESRSRAAATDYRIGPGDALRVLVFQQPDLSLELRVSESGRITYPLLGVVAVGGLTARELEAALESGLREGRFVRQPQVSVSVLQVRGHQVSVLGQVGRPGRYPVDAPGLRLSELLAQAGGVIPTGADRLVLVGLRRGQPWRLEVDLPQLFVAGGGDEPEVMGGDVVFVERAPLVYVYGEVQRPGALRLERDMTLLQALAAGGGPTLRGTERGLRVHRRGADGRWVVMRPALDAALQPGDVVQVPESLF